MRNFIDIVCGILTEATVINPDAVDKEVDRIVSDVTARPAREWLRKRIRSEIMNNTNYLRAAMPSELEKAPDYAHDAAVRGETVYVFDHRDPRLGQFLDTIQHLKDWIGSMEMVLKEKPTNQVETENHTITAKLMSKLPKMTFDQALRAADEWFTRMGRSSKGVEALQDVKVIKRWPDGCYAVEYKSADAMKRDGNMLDNCLRVGYYWDAVASGRDRVITIRKPSHEAVVAIRIHNSPVTKDGIEYSGTVVECKGKQNRPPTSRYIPYCTSLLSELNVNGGNCSDLNAAGIHFHRGRFGDTWEIGDKIYEDPRNDVVVYRVDRHVIFRIDKFTCNAVIHGNLILLDAVPDGIDIKKFARALRGIDFALAPDSVERLRKIGLYINRGQIGTFLEVGDKISDDGKYTAIRVGKDIVVAMSGELVATFNLGKDKQIIEVRPAHAAFRNDITRILNLTKAAPSPIFEAGFMLRHEIFFDGKTYGTFDQVAVKDGDLYRLGKRPVWVVPGEDGTFLLSITKGQARALTKPFQVAPEAVRRLLAREGVSSVEDPKFFGVVKLNGRIIATKEDFLKSLKELKAAIPPNAFTLNSVREGDVDVISQVRRFLMASENNLTAKDRALIIRTINGTGGVKITLEKKEKIYGVDVGYYRIDVPVAAFNLFAPYSLTSEESRKIVEHLTKAAEHVRKSKAQIFQSVTIPHTLVDARPEITQAYRALMNEIVAANRSVVDHLKDQQRRDDLDLDLSSRFASLHALNKLKR